MFVIRLLLKAEIRRFCLAIWQGERSYSVACAVMAVAAVLYIIILLITRNMLGGVSLIFIKMLEIIFFYQLVLG